MKLLFEARQDCGGWFSWISIPGVASIVEDLRVGLQALAEGFRDQAPTTAKDATAVILEAVRLDKWRILVGEDAKILDEMVRQDPQGAYSIEFFDKLNERGILGGLTGEFAAQPPSKP